MITWNDLARAFLPEATGGDPVDGVFKKCLGRAVLRLRQRWPGRPVRADRRCRRTPTDGSRWSAGADLDPGCGRFAADVCAPPTCGSPPPGGPTRQPWRCCAQSSPAGVLDRINAPTLLIQGEADSCSRCPRRTPTPAASRPTAPRCGWPGSPAATTAARDRTRTRTGSGPHRAVARPLRRTATATRRRPASPTPGSPASTPVDTGWRPPATRYRGLPGSRRQRRRSTCRSLAGPPRWSPTRQAATRPRSRRCRSPAARPRSSTVWSAEIPGQHAAFTSAPLTDPVDVVGAPTVRLRAASPTGEAVLFVKLYDVDPAGSATLPPGWSRRCG